MIKEKSKHYRAIKVKYLGYTNTKSSRIKFIDERFGESKTIGYGLHEGDTLEQAIEFLSSNGFSLVGHAEMENCYVIFCDNWGAECVKLKSIK